MKTNWFIISLVTGIASGFLSFLIVNSWKINLLIGIIVTVLMLINNPIKRYMRAFWILLGLFSTIHKFSFEVIGSLSGINFQFGSNQIHWVVSVGLLILALTCLRLDFLERNGKLKGTFLSIQKNKVGDITGNANTINQTNV